MSQSESAPQGTGNDRIRDASERMREAARAKADAIKREAESQAELSKSNLAGRAFTIASAIRTAGRELEAQGEPLGVYAEMAGDKVAELSRYLEDRSTGDLMAEIEAVARRQPWIVVGGAFAIGVVAGRFLKAGAGRDVGIEPHEDYGLSTESDYALTQPMAQPKGGGDGFGG